MQALPLAFGSLDLGGVVASGLIFGAVFGFPVAAIRSAFAQKGQRLSRFGSTTAASFVGAFLVMLLVWAVGP